MVNQKRIEVLILKKLHGEISPEENRELLALAKTSEQARQQIDSISREDFREKLHTPDKIDFRTLDRLTKQKIGNIPGILDWVPETRPNKFFSVIRQFLRHFGRPPAR